MGLIAVNDAFVAMDELAQGLSLKDSERSFIYRFAFITDDKQMTRKMISEIVEAGEDKSAVISKYETMVERKPEITKNMEDLLIAMELYRMEEAKMIDKIQKMLLDYGINLSKDEIRSVSPDEIKKKELEENEQEKEEIKQR